MIRGNGRATILRIIHMTVSQFLSEESGQAKDLKDCDYFVLPLELNSYSFSLTYNDLARWLFITLAFMGILATGWFGIPLAPRYLALHQVDTQAEIFTLLSALGTIWGV